MEDRPLSPDATLAERAQDGDTGAFDTLLRRHQDTVYRIALRVLGDAADAADTAQEALITAWRKLPELENTAVFSAWLYRIVTNRALNAVRSRIPAAPIDEGLPTAAPGPEHQSMASQLRGALTRALANLPPGQRACWILRELEGMSYEEIAQIVNATPTAVRGRIHRARTHLVEALRLWR
ncbi:RNA polymerase sigma factor [Marinactinospora thermotolerans]|uniref:RNA polymerase, sigma subunit, ECF family n=1 Tax=Marinactinospora thermotolerans DSM 45154 TaxID=1122192 RepID=A0A1T4RX79_9ACTN|nr:sigma-70 family RNA polymerase sigma factor [Marinactinospora thermotolerans]SKA20348.1 RNA polymerase, sigma subunit, ECF family [Marinactinospora thermotolerans DSM 45154]